MIITVKNIHSGERRPTSEYGSWLEYWMHNKGVTGTVNCANLICNGKAKHGGHVKKVYSDDGSWYIVPLCVSCNEAKDKVFQVDSSSLVSVR